MQEHFTKSTESAKHGQAKGLYPHLRRVGQGLGIDQLTNAW